jgi:hypothetical protein
MACVTTATNGTKAMKYYFKPIKSNTMTQKQKFDVLSPDGFSIHFSDTYSSEKKAMKAFDEWKKRYELQGYYSSSNGKIPLNELHNYIRIIKLKN